MPATNLFYKDTHFDSDEEVFFAHWCEELKNHPNEYILAWEKIKEPMAMTDGLKVTYQEEKVMKTKTKIVTKTKELLKASEYTPDFRILFGPGPFLSLIHDFFNPKALFYTNKFPEAIIEVKPDWDMQNMTRLYKLNQKFIWDKYDTFVNLVHVEDLFKATFVPAESLPYFTYKKAPTGKNKGKKGVGDFKLDWEPKTLKQYVYSISYKG